VPVLVALVGPDTRSPNSWYNETETVFEAGSLGSVKVSVLDVLIFTSSIML